MPFPIEQLDRAKNLERSWEEACIIDNRTILDSGFLATTRYDECVYLLHSTHAENGRSVLLSNVDIATEIFTDNEDFFDVISTDIPYSTAISLTARFPFVTPPAKISTNGETWGHLVDGGYVDNMGGNSMLKLYDHLKNYSKRRQYKVKFTLVFLRNIKQESHKPISAMHELLAPLTTFNKVWVNNIYF